MYKVLFTKQAKKDAVKLKSAHLKAKAEDILQILQSDPFQAYPPYEKLLGDLAGAFSRRINIQHRIVYQVLEEQKTVKVLRMWTHYQ